VRSIRRNLSTPLLKKEDNESNDESRPISLPKESLPQPKSNPSISFFLNGCFDLSILRFDSFVIDVDFTEISECGERFGVFALCREVSR